MGTFLALNSVIDMTGDSHGVDPPAVRQTRPVRRILLECTDTYFSDWNTGIQRVVRNVAANCVAAGQDLNVQCKPIVRLGDQYKALPWRPHITRPASPLARWLGQLHADAEFWERTAWHRFLRRFGVRLRKLFYPRTLARKLVQLRRSLQGETIVPGPGDTLVLLDAWWNRNIWPSVAQARLNGARIGVVMYDLLPVTNPEFFKSNVKEPFTASLRIALQQGDYFLAISRAVRDALRDYAHRHGPLRNQHASFASFRLGSTLDLVSRQGKIRESLREALQPGEAPAPYLTVGTIEPRKNHVLLLDAFEQVWDSHPQARLVIVGRVGWLCEQLVQRIVRHPRYKKSLFMFNDLTDSELDFCYRQAKAFLFPSHAEGFGLPVVEALQYGLRVMVSDIPIHREVGRDFCAYFDPHSPTQLAQRICEFEAGRNVNVTRQPSEFELPNWSDSTRDFVRQCLAACQCELTSSGTAREAA